MSKFTIDWIEKKKSKLGNDYASASITREDGSKLQGVAIFSSFPDFASLAAGKTVEGVLKEKMYNGNVSYTLESEQKPVGKGGGNIAKAQERKAEDIKNAQDRKEEGIRLAATMRDATLLTVEWIKKQTFAPSDDEIRNKWQDWRKWLELNFGDGQPF